jgi:Entner-Doudoroff aldolase
VTVQFVGQRPDIAADKPAGEASPEYEAFEQAGPNEVMVLSSVGPWESVGGDIKFLRLKQLNVGGLVTDGSVRDTDVLLEYGFPVYSYSTTPRQGPHVHQPWSCNSVIMCGGITVRPGDAIIGDQDGVIVVPAAVAQEVYDIAHSREVVENIVKEELVANPGPPGKFYPFITGKIKPESNLGKLLTSKGVKFYSSAASSGRSSTSMTRRSGNSLFGGATTRGFAASSAGRRSFSSATGVRPIEEMEKTVAWFGEHKATAVLRTNTAEAAPLAMDAALRAGFKIAEFTLTTPGCLDTMADFRSKHPDVMIGCGTVMNADMCAKALEAGAQFIVSPCLIPEVVTYCAERNVACVPGCNTPTELYTAYKLGAPIQKVFPGMISPPVLLPTILAGQHCHIYTRFMSDANCTVYISNLILAVMLYVCV